MIQKEPEWLSCDDCGGQIEITVWGEGIDSSIKCKNCDNRDIYR